MRNFVRPLKVRVAMRSAVHAACSRFRSAPQRGVGSPPARSNGNKPNAQGQQDQGSARFRLVLDAPEDRRVGLGRQVDSDDDPDFYCWPASSAMNSAEIVAFTKRIAFFTDRGMRLRAAEDLADSLVLRDRECDDRKICMECRHMRRYGGCAVFHLTLRIDAVPLTL